MTVMRLHRDLARQRRQRVAIAFLFLAVAWGAGLASSPLWADTHPPPVLQPVPPPNLERLEPAVRERLREAQSEFQAAIGALHQSREALAREYGEMGRLYHAQHLNDSAQACYLNAQTLDPQERRWPYLLAYLYQESGSLEQAAQSYRRALELAPQDALTELRLGQVYLALNQPQQARPLLEAALADPALRGAAAYALGKAAFIQHQFATAVQRYNEALAQQPQASRIHYALAMAYRGSGDVASARKHLELRGEVEPRVPDPEIDELEQLLSGARAHLYRAMKAVWAGQFDVAAEEFRQVVALDPQDVSSRVSLARALYMLGDRQGSEAQLRAALAQQGANDQANYFLGRLLEERGDLAGAEQHYVATLAANPRHGGAHLFLGNALMRAGKYGEAAAHYDKVVEELPQDLRARQLQAMALIADPRRHKEARQRLEAALAVHPDDPTLRRAQARLLAASPDASVRDGKRALSLAQGLYHQVNSIENAETLAMAYAELGRFPSAVAFQQAALQAALQYGGFFLSGGLNANLDRYREGKPCRTPWPADDPVFRPQPLDSIPGGVEDMTASAGGG